MKTLRIMIEPTTGVPAINSSAQTRGCLQRFVRCCGPLTRTIRLIAIVAVAIGCCSPTEAQFGGLLRGIRRATDNVRAARKIPSRPIPGHASSFSGVGSARTSDQNASDQPWLSPLAPTPSISPTIPNPPVISKVASGSTGTANTSRTLARVTIGALLFGAAVVPTSLAWYLWKREQRRRREVEESMQSRCASV